MARSWLVTLVLAVAACAPASPRPDASEQPSSAAEPAATGVAASSASTAPNTPQPSSRFVPSPPIVGFATPALAGAASCVVTDHVLGPADDVTRSDGGIVPVTLAFGPKGGIALWRHKGRRVVRPLDRTGAPSAPQVDGPQDAGGLTVVPSDAGFILAFLDDKTVTFHRLSEAGSLNASTGGVTLPLDPGAVLGAFAWGPRTLLVAGERGDPPTGLSSRLVVVDAEFASGGRSRTATRTVYMPRALAADTAIIPGKKGETRVFVVDWPSGDRALVETESVQRIGVEIDFLTTEHLVPDQLAGGDTSKGYRYALSSRPRYPLLRSEKPSTSEEARFTLADKNWTGLDDVHWTGERFVTSRLSGPKGKVEARVFSIDCARK